MSFSILVLAEDPDLVLGTNLLQFFSGRPLGCPQSMSLTILVLAEDPDLVL
jgi:hypothetical protein